MGKLWIVAAGSTGAGKTTHMRELAKRHGFCHISSGDIARSMMDSQTDALFKEGQLSPHETAIQTKIVKELREHDVCLLDGFPRIIEQYVALKLWAQELKARIIVVYFDVAETILKERWGSRRRDAFDTTHAAEKRHELYGAYTHKVLSTMVEDGLQFIDITLTEERPIEVVSDFINMRLTRPLETFRREIMGITEAEILVDKFLADHHFQRWWAGQATTYATTKEDVKKRLMEIVRAAAEPSMHT